MRVRVRARLSYPWVTRDNPYYRRFISDYSDIVVPLTRLTRKGVVWNFSDDARKSFEALKAAFTSAPVLTH